MTIDNVTASRDVQWYRPISEPKPIIDYIPVDDGWGVIGYILQCQCGQQINCWLGERVCSQCGFVVPDEPDPDDWYMAKYGGFCNCDENEVNE
jgi:hypothetical protein